MSKTITIMLLFMIYLIMASCSKHQAEEIKPEQPPTVNPPANSVSYASTVGPLFQSRCGGCHAAGRSAAGIWTFNGHASIVSRASGIRQVVLVSKTMPRGGTLSAAELASLQSWFDNGMLNN